MFLYNFSAFFTLNPATPVKLTVTVLSFLDDQRLIPATATHQSAAVQSEARLVALATPSTQRPIVWVIFTKVWRFL